jgi:hypothetical protein
MVKSHFQTVHFPALVTGGIGTCERYSILGMNTLGKKA